MPISTAMIVTGKKFGASGFCTSHGVAKPELDRYTPRNGLALLIAGSPRITTKYQTKSCTSTGVLRRISTYTSARRPTSQLLESRPMPTSTPNTVARIMPVTATRKVLYKPTKITLM